MGLLIVVMGFDQRGVRCRSETELISGSGRCVGKIPSTRGNKLSSRVSRRH